MTQPKSPLSGSLAPVVFHRQFNAPKDIVFAVWTNPDHMKHWLHPSSEWSNPVVEVDLCVGGEYRLGFRHREEPDLVYVVGTFLQVEFGERLMYTWSWEPPDPNAGLETLVTVDFSASDGGTEVTLIHERFPDDATRQRHTEGWTGAFVCLTNYMETL